ncbi:metalloendoproteinase 2-MMP-like [Oryza brachyantha]|uniref:metalloendoproteinase 2-MMP-like n=1 Tax=Oryza brachyantha TaxID=4533 RepID=UPI001ADB38AF|nr:metalloendoproteinase 2-MMP-like [Oryza brachyantha]
MATITSPLVVLLAVAAATTVLVVVSPVSALPAGLPDIKAPFNNPWSAFKNLSGCHFGDERAGLGKLKNYLWHFGYLSYPNSSSSPSPSARFNDLFDADMEMAIKVYQGNFGLDVTGELDAPTVAQMMAPRCGVADVVNGVSTMGNSSGAVRGRGLYSYFQGSPRWPRSKTTLRYAITATSQTTIDRATLSRVFASAFAQWSAATMLNFTETASASDAEITIGFYAGDHGDGEAFDGPLGTLAHAFSPTNGRLHLDASEAWVAGGDVTRASSNAAVDLESVAVHEIGHILGLGHSSAADSIMFPTLTSRTKKVNLASDDVAGIQGLYGNNPNFKGVTPPSTSSREMDTAGAGELSRPWRGLVDGAAGVAIGFSLALL